MKDDKVMKKRNIFKYSKRAYALLRNIQPNDLYKYVPNYDEMSLCEKLSSVAGGLGEVVLLPIFKLYFVLQAKSTPMRKKLYIMGALGYFILPVDLIPDFLPAIIGFSDDLVVVSYVLKLVNDYLTPELEVKALNAYKTLTRSKKKSHATLR